ncbi:MAG: DedA family protein [Pseudonocardiaceae bacterium]|nr:DedA family protein [Pseudonocardiaceae bacterium]
MVELVRGALATPWGYFGLFVFAMVDAFFPVVPSESLMITAGVFAATGQPALLSVIVASAFGAFVGDHISYALGRGAGGRLGARMVGTARRRAAFDWAAAALAERGGLILVVARYIPGGRTAATITAGAVGYPLRRFSAFAGLAAATWATYSALIGYLGGMAFENDPVKGLLAGLGLALAITVAVEVTRHLLRRHARREHAPV